MRNQYRVPGPITQLSESENEAHDEVTTQPKKKARPKRTADPKAKCPKADHAVKPVIKKPGSNMHAAPLASISVTCELECENGEHGSAQLDLDTSDLPGCAKKCPANDDAAECVADGVADKRYYVMLYHKDQRAAIRQNFGSKTQILSVCLHM